MLKHLYWGRYALVGSAVLVLVCSAPRIASASPITIANPGFETGDTTGWTFAAASQGSDFSVAADDPHSGVFAADFGATSIGFYDSISQNLTTTAGQSALVTFWLANDATPANDFQVLWNGSVVIDILNSNPFPYRLFSFIAPTPSSSSTLMFRGYQIPGFFHLDDVSAQTAPEPASLVLLGSGLALLVRRKLRA